MPAEFKRHCPPCVEAAIADLGHPGPLWFRGHAGTHRLLPTLLRFPGGAANESRIIERFRREKGIPHDEHPVRVLEALHHDYQPTRLLAWTSCLRVALFCALVREADEAVVFVLDPIRLNAMSARSGILKLTAAAPLAPAERFLEEFTLSEPPIAVEVAAPARAGTSNDSLFTVHGTCLLPLEVQCPSCVRRVLFTEQERELTMAALLSGSDQW